MARPIKTTDELRASYNSYYEHNAMYERSDYFYEWLLSLLAPTAGSSLLDVSCGEGHLLKQVEASANSIRSTGIDLSDVALAKARTRLKKTELLSGNAEKLPFPDGIFDYATNIGSMEHYLDNDKAIGEMARVLKTGGRAMVLVPNRYHWRDIWRAFRKGRGQLPTEQGIENTDSREGWADKFRNNGLECEQIIKYERVARPTSTDAKPCRMVWYHHIVPLNLCFSFVYILKKKP